METQLCDYGNCLEQYRPLTFFIKTKTCSLSLDSRNNQHPSF